MNDSCNSIRPLLSAYFDEELSLEAANRVAGHVMSCAQCRAELESFRQISDCMQSTAGAEPPPVIWDRIEREMMPSKPTRARVAPATSWAKDSQFAAGMIVLAASVLLVVGAGIWLFSRPHSDGGQLAHNGSMEHHDEVSAAHMAEFVHVMDEYLQELPEDPNRAEQLLLDKYKGKRVDERQAMELVGYRPIVSQGLPEGYSLASTSVLQMPCCTCVKAVCRRGDGSTLVLFEHDDEEVAWFGTRPSKLTTCGDKECCLVELDENVAATWKQGTRSITAVGVRDQDEVATFVTWLQDAKTNG